METSAQSSETIRNSTSQSRKCRSSKRGCWKPSQSHSRIKWRTCRRYEQKRSERCMFLIVSCWKARKNVLKYNSVIKEFWKRKNVLNTDTFSYFTETCNFSLNDLCMQIIPNHLAGVHSLDYRFIFILLFNLNKLISFML